MQWGHICTVGLSQGGASASPSPLPRCSPEVPPPSTAQHSTALQLLFQISQADLWEQRAREGLGCCAGTHRNPQPFQDHFQFSCNSTPFFQNQVTEACLCLPIPGDNNQGNAYTVSYSQAHHGGGFALKKHIFVRTRLQCGGRVIKAQEAHKDPAVTPEQRCCLQLGDCREAFCS